MGVMSSLALVLIPLLRRDSSTTVPIDSETKRLKAELTESQAEVDRLRREILRWMDIAQSWRERAEARAMPMHRINEQMRQRAEAQLQTQAQQANQTMEQNFYQDGQYLQSNFFSQAQQSALGQGSVWLDCTGVPGQARPFCEETTGWLVTGTTLSAH